MSEFAAKRALGSIRPAPRHVSGLPVSQSQPCPGIGTANGEVFGDVNCDDSITAVDSLLVLRSVSLLPVNLPQGCHPIGT